MIYTCQTPAAYILKLITGFLQRFEQWIIMGIWELSIKNLLVLYGGGFVSDILLNIYYKLSHF